jgi:hypothetical protein
MHPEIITNQAGKCPKCGMALVIKDLSEEDRKINVDHIGHSTSSHTNGCH